MNGQVDCPSITVLICTLNEEENLPHVLPQIPGWVDETLLVDGRSTDRTVEVARELKPDVKVLYQPAKGKGDALRYGIEHATGDIIVTLDADGATNPEEMSKFIEPLLSGYDFAKGSRFLNGFPHHKPWHRILGNWIITITFDVFFFRKYTDLCSGYNAFWRKAIERIDLWSPDGFQNEPFINTRLMKARLKVIEVPHSDERRLNGDVKELSWRQGFKAIKTIIRERFYGW
ncbi:Polyprenol monophosphomannose synthase [subsurface metagenome]